ncbi:MAG TPA: S8 family serine peptidase, partial [Candidatus Nitrosotalea sp.]|nr:S8 family serine peptidase [Candidatus Nitrosotalea sp.]
MRFNSRTLGLLSILFFLAAVWFWLRGNEEVAKRQAAKQTDASKSPTQTPAGTNAGNSQAAGTVPPRTGATSSAPANAVAPAAHDGFPYRLRNTAKSIDELGRVNTAILLDNAFIDTSIPGQLEIPEHLRATGDSGSYIVQASGSIDPAFYSRLRDAGAEFVSYIPNNACLVRATSEQAAQLADSPQIQAVLKYQPYFKLAESLLPLAVEKQSLPNDQMLNVVVFPGQHDPASAAIKDLGGTIVAEDRSPFGPILVVQPHPDSLPALAALSEVQRIEPASSRVVLNDLTRVRLSVSPDSVTPASYLDLKGEGVTMNINDTGVDATHPDLTGRVSSTDTNSLTVQDFDGHGTHVAGIMASSGGSSSTVVGADGSVPGADFRGKASKANLFVLPIDLLTGPLLSDSYLQETAARANYISGAKTDPMISNNSWGYPGALQYNSASASYDEAVRDALPGVP